MAAHALHLSFSLEAFTDWIVGTRDKTYDWKASWAQSTVSESKWRKLLERIAVQANNLTHAMTRHAAANPESAWGAAGALAHTAFPLGAIQVTADVLLKDA